MDQRPADVLEALGLAANMRFVPSGGMLRPVVGVAAAPVLTITDADVVITQGQTFTPFKAMGDSYNALSATYPEPGEKWASKDAPEYVDPDATAADGGQYRPTSLTYSAAPYAAQVQRLGLEARVRMLPPMPAREAFALARTIVVPSRAEAMPYIVLEALAAGKPQIATAVSGIPEIFPPASPALAEPTVDSVATAMAAAISDEEKFAALMPGRQELEARFSVAAMAASVEDAYRASLAG